MEFVSELLMYLFKFVVYIAVTIVAVLCGIKLKKNKLAKAAAEVDEQKMDIAENEA